MAGLQFKSRVSQYAVASSAKTAVAVVAPTNQRVRIWGWSFTFNGTDSTKVPVLVELVEFDGSTAGTATTVTAGNVPKLNSSLTEVIQSVVKNTYTVEPTVARVIDSWNINQTTGYGENPPFQMEYWCPGGKTWGLRVTGPAGVTCLADVALNAEE